MIRSHVLSALFLVTASAGCTIEGGESTSSTEQLSSVHLKGGAHAKPSFKDLGLSLEEFGSLSGLGGGDVLISVDAEANPTATCGNPGTNTFEAPGRNPAPVDVTGSESIPAPEVKNGETPFDVTTDPPPTHVAGAVDCPNSSWTEIITDLAFTSATMTVEQPVGTTVLVVTCTFNPPTSNGPVPGNTVTCL